VCSNAAIFLSHKQISAHLLGFRKEKKRKEKTTPFGVNLMRSQKLYRAAQMLGFTYTCNAAALLS